MAASCVWLLWLILHPCFLRISMLRHQEMLCDRQIGSALLCYSNHIHFSWNLKASDVHTNDWMHNTKANTWDAIVWYKVYKEKLSGLLNRWKFMNCLVLIPYIHQVHVGISPMCQWLCGFCLFVRRVQRKTNGNYFRSKRQFSLDQSIDESKTFEVLMFAASTKMFDKSAKFLEQKLNRTKTL